jgi:hypothetical protein
LGQRRKPIVNPANAAYPHWNEAGDASNRFRCGNDNRAMSEVRDDDGSGGYYAPPDCHPNAKTHIPLRHVQSDQNVHSAGQNKPLLNIGNQAQRSSCNGGI